MINTLDKIIYNAIKNEELSFIGTTLQCMSIRINEFIPTAGVMFNKEIKQFELIINPKYWDNLKSDDERIAVFVHELNHIFFKHVFIPKEIMLSKNKSKINISMDLVINQLIKNLPEGCFVIEKIKDKNKKPFKSNLTFEEYYDLLDDATMEVPDCSGQPQDHDSYKKEQKSKGKGEKNEQGSPEDGEDQSDGGKHTGHNCDGTCSGKDGDKKPGKKGTKTVNVKDYYEEQPFDTHGWDEADSQEAMEATRDLIKRSMQKAAFTGSKVPGHVQDCLDNVNVQLKRMNCKELLKLALRQSLPSKDTQKTWKRPSRRLGDIAKGNMSGKMPKIEDYTDTSGSISIIEANQMMSNLNEFLTCGVSKATLFLWHTEIYHKEIIKKNFQIKPENFQSGGTDLQPVIDQIHKNKPDMAIIHTDGFYGNTILPKGFKTPIVFIITPQGTEEHPLHKYGKTVKMSE